ncbi:hypothetical protein FKP32DRAFT_1261695 [Trametes sanguinea]|nr:hypothetical protein FKP32DRAFT_1261695 [Trametes sanguinea]
MKEFDGSKFDRAVQLAFPWGIRSSHLAPTLICIGTRDHTGNTVSHRCGIRQALRQSSILDGPRYPALAVVPLLCIESTVVSNVSRSARRVGGRDGAVEGAPDQYLEVPALLRVTLIVAVKVATDTILYENISRQLNVRDDQQCIASTAGVTSVP